MTDKELRTLDEIKKTTATINLNARPKDIIMNVVEVSDESIEKIADAVVRKLTDRKTEPQTSCKTCSYSEVDEGYVRCAYYSKATEQDEPQTDTITFTYTEEEWNEIQDWKDRMWAEAVVTEPQTERSEK